MSRLTLYIVFKHRYSEVGVGRPIIWGLAVDGEQGARRVLDILRKDFELTMRLCGCAGIADIEKDLLF